MANAITTLQKDSMVLEPIVIGSMQANAYVGPVDGVSPCLTSAMGEGGGHIPMITEVEPVIIQKVGDRGTNNYSVKKIANTIPANPMSDRGQLLEEPILPHKHIFIRYGFGFGQQGFSEEIAYTINSSAFENNNFIVEIPPQFYKPQKGLRR